MSNYYTPKLFNLKKAQVPMPPAASPMMQSPEGTPAMPDFGSVNQMAEQPGELIEQEVNLQNEETRFLDASELHDFLINNNYITVRDFLNEQNISVEELSKVEELLKRYYENQEMKTSEEQLETAVSIFNMLPASLKQEREENELSVPARFRGFASMNDYINKVNIEIETLAKIAAKKTSKSFNLTKVAQHGWDGNYFMWGPKETRIDPFLHQPVSDWHILERNKGFGQDIDGVWNIDWETFWRGNIMDKYSRPYRDTKTGEWIGGYIQKRFEVDKNVPVTSNYQLLPGELRKPRLPEYGLTEARLQEMRSKDNRGYGPITDTSKPFNWNTASSARLVKKAIAVSNDAMFNDDIPTDIQKEFNKPDENYNLSENDKLIIKTRFNDVMSDPDSMRQFVSAYKKSHTVAAIEMLRLQVDEPQFEAMKNYMQNLWMQIIQSRMTGGEGLSSRVASKKKVV